MLNKIALCVAIVLGTGSAASAAARHYTFTPAPSPYYAVPGSGTCSAVHPPFCSNVCDGSPCHVNGDY
jgi:hypothetical protein